MAASFCKCFRAGPPAPGSAKARRKVAPAFSGIGGPPSVPGPASYGDDYDSDDEIAMSEHRNTALRARQQADGSSFLSTRDASVDTDCSFESEDSSFSALTMSTTKARFGGSGRPSFGASLSSASSRFTEPDAAPTHSIARGVAVASDAEATSAKRSSGSPPPETPGAGASGRGFDDGNIGLELRRCLPTQHWGFVWRGQIMERCSERVLEKVLRGSPAEMWNTDHPGQEVQAGDVLVRVNGKGGRIDLMTAELGKMHVFCEFRPGDARHFYGSAASSSCCTGVSTRTNTEVGCVSMESTSASCRDGPYPTAKLPTPKAVEAPSPGAANVAGLRGVYRVRLRRESPSQRWGLMWDETAMERSELRVLSKVTPGSLAADWNATNPAQEMQVGDTLLSVNGKAGRMELLSLELRQNEVVCEFKPGGAQLAPAEAVAPKNAAPVASPASGPGAPPPTQQCFPASGNRKSGSSATPTCGTLVTLSDLPWSPINAASPASGHDTPTTPQCFRVSGKSKSGLSDTPTCGTLRAEAEPLVTLSDLPSSLIQALPPSADTLASSRDNAQRSRSGRYRVEMRRPSKATRWGFVWDTDAMAKRHVHVIRKVLPGTIAETWNDGNPGQEMQVGDRLVSINGRSGMVELLTTELSKEHIVCEFQSAAVQPPDCRPLPQAAALHLGDSDARGGADKPVKAADTRAGRAAPAPLSLSMRNSIAAGRGKGGGAAPLLLPLSPRRSRPPSPLGVEPAAVAASAAAAAEDAAAVAASAAAVAAAAVPSGIGMAGGDDAALDRGTDDAPQEEAHRTLNSMSPVTLAARWNTANPGLQTQPGDALVSGGAGKPELQSVELNLGRTSASGEPRSARELPAAACPRSEQGAGPSGGGERLPASQHAVSPGAPKPPWWEAWPEGGGQVISAAPEAVREAVQHIMHMGCPAGCRFEVVKVLHNKHAELWQAYFAARSHLKRHGGMASVAMSPPLGPPVRACMGVLDSDAGECLLLHGTKPNSVELACQGCFGSGGWAATGSPTAASGVHLYEASCAADLCAQHNLEGRDAGLCALMLCRASCGTSLLMEAASLDDMASTLQESAFSESFDSAVCGDPASRCREVVVRDKTLVYPEYVVLYRRALVTDSCAV